WHHRLGGVRRDHRGHGVQVHAPRAVTGTAHCMCRSKQTPLRRGFLFKGNANELRTVRPDSFHPGILPRVFWAGVEMKGILRVALLIACAWGHAAWAEDYYWRYNSQNYPSADAACRAHLDVMKAQNSAYVDYRVELTTPISGKCVLLSKTGASLGSAIIGRQGDGCTD